MFKKLKSLEDIPQGQLAGKMGVVIDLMTRLPVEIWFKENPKTNETKFEENLLNLVTASTLILLDRGFYHFNFWLQLIGKEIHFITRLKKGAAIKVLEVFTEGYSLRDRKIRLGSGTKTTPYITLRLIEVKSGKVWHSYLTSVLDPLILPPYVVADLYRKRWRIEEAFNLVKRLLGLSYLWVAKDPVKYFASSDNKDLGIVKQKRKKNTELIIAPFPEKQRNTPEFFFSTNSPAYA